MMKRFALWALLAGLVMMAQACGPTGDDDDSATTPTPAVTPTPEPDELYFDETYIDVSCTSTYWDIWATVDGWTEFDTPWFGIYDNTAWYDEGDTMIWAEEHDMYWEGSYDDAGYYEDLSLYLDIVATFDEQTPGESSIFTCDNIDFLTYSMCAYDYYYDTGEWCVFFGNEPDYWSTAMGY